MGRHAIGTGKPPASPAPPWRIDEVKDVAITPDGRFAVAAVSGRGGDSSLGIDDPGGERFATVSSYHEGGWCPTLAITPDARRVLVGFARSNENPLVDLAVVDLEAVPVSPCRTPTADLALLAELATARHIELGDLSGMTTGQWLERWSFFASGTRTSRRRRRSDSDLRNPGAAPWLAATSTSARRFVPRPEKTEV